MADELARLERSLHGSRAEAIEALENVVRGLVVGEDPTRSLRSAA